MHDPRTLAREGLCSFEFASEARCEDILRRVRQHVMRHGVRVIERPERPRALKYGVIDGCSIARHLPELVALYEEINTLLREDFGLDLVRLDDQVAGVNVNIMSPGHTYRWHYDRNSVTAILFLNTVEGGELEAYPGHRALLPLTGPSTLQRWLDRLMASRWVREMIGHKVTIAPRTGTLVIMRGDRCLHGVKAVTAGRRVNVVMTFDARDAQFAVQDALDSYLYTSEPTRGFDPNYLPWRAR